MLVGRSRRTACCRGYPFLSDRRYGVLVYERFLAQPSGMHIDILPSFVLSLSVSLIAFVYQAHSGTICIIVHYRHPNQSSGKRGVCKRLHVILGVMISLGSDGLIRDFPNNLNELNPSVHILLEDPQFFCRPGKDSRLTQFRYRDRD